MGRWGHLLVVGHSRFLFHHIRKRSAAKIAEPAQDTVVHIAVHVLDNRYLVNLKNQTEHNVVFRSQTNIIIIGPDSVVLLKLIGVIEGGGGGYWVAYSISDTYLLLMYAVQKWTWQKRMIIDLRSALHKVCRIFYAVSDRQRRNF